MIYIGIDNGLSGALVALSDCPGPPVSKIVMPTRGKSSGNEVDAVAVRDWMLSLGTIAQLSVVIETPGKFSKGVQAISSMWDSYGALRSLCEVVGIRHHRISPQAWQRSMLPNCAKGDTKPAAKARAAQLWPRETWIPNTRSKKPHGGLIDAALIAEYGRIRGL